MGKTGTDTGHWPRVGGLLMIAGAAVATLLSAAADHGRDVDRTVLLVALFWVVILILVVIAGELDRRTRKSAVQILEERLGNLERGLRARLTQVLHGRVYTVDPETKEIVTLDLCPVLKRGMKLRLLGTVGMNQDYTAAAVVHDPVKMRSTITVEEVIPIGELGTDPLVRYDYPISLPEDEDES